MDSSTVISLIVFGVLLIFGAIFYISTKKGGASNKNDKVKTNQKEDNTAYKKSHADAVNKEDIFKFMDFDKIQDNMIVQKNGEKYTAVIKCKGINYNLMSEVEQLSVEEGFINFLNTLKFPIQLYVQAQNVDLNENIKKYKDNMKELYEKYDEANSKYNMLVNSLDSTDEEIESAENEKNSVLNVLEYGQDIVKYVEKLSLNKSMLQRNFYVLVSYYKSEITNASSFNKEELIDICYNELFTRVQNIMSGLAMSSVYGQVLESNDLAELLYSAYNRDDKNYISVRQALDAGFYRLYSTSKDAIQKKNEKLVEGLRQEAELKAVQALRKAVEEGNITTMQDIEDEYDQESSKQAIDIIKHENIDENTKEKAKKIVINEYKEAKKKRMEQKEEELKRIVGKEEAQISDEKNENKEEASENTESNEQPNTTNNDTTDNDNESIV